MMIMYRMVGLLGMPERVIFRLVIPIRKDQTENIIWTTKNASRLIATTIPWHLATSKAKTTQKIYEWSRTELQDQTSKKHETVHQTYPCQQEQADGERHTERVKREEETVG